MEGTVFYYSDELNDDFADNKIEDKPLPKNFEYINKKFFWNIGAFIFYRLIAMPCAYLFCKIKFGTKFVNAGALRKHKGGCYVFANHTQGAGDAFVPNLAAFPRKNYIIVGRAAVSSPLMRFAVMQTGGLPLPKTLSETKSFYEAMDSFISRGAAVTIFPEAHIWPYYTKIRPYKEGSFRYAVGNKVPCFSLTVTYHKGSFGRTKQIVYVDGPFYPDLALPKKEAELKLRDEVYAAMVKRSELNSFEKIKYVKKTEEL